MKLIGSVIWVLMEPVVALRGGAGRVGSGTNPVLRLAAAAVLGLLAVGVEPAALRRRRLVLDAGLGRVQVQTAVLDVLVDLLGRLQKRLLYVLSSGEQNQNQNQE